MRKSSTLTNRNWNNEFRQIMIGEASQERSLKGSLEWLIFGKTDLVTEKFLDKVDEEALAKQLADYYGLDSEGINEAFELCEQQIMDEAAHHDQT